MNFTKMNKNNKTPSTSGHTLVKVYTLLAILGLVEAVIFYCVYNISV